MSRTATTKAAQDATSASTARRSSGATNDATGVEYHDAVLWAQLADFATSYLGKGRLVYVRGRLQTRTWQAGDGSTRRVTEVIADRLQALSKIDRTASAA